MKASGPHSSGRLSSARSRTWLVMATAVVLAVGLFAVTFFTRHRGKVLTIFAGALGVVLFMGAVVGFATGNSTGACSFI